MKTLLLFIGVSFIFNYGYSQDTTLPKAEVTKKIIDNKTEYSFKSNYYIPEWKASQLSNRLKVRYTEINSITIDAETQIVTFTLIDSIEIDSFINSFVKHFKYSGYEIH